MFFNGSVLGFFLGGCLSLLSSMTSSLIGYFFGKAFYKKINQKYSGTEIQKASFIINNYGFIGLILTRGVPILSEAVSILAGNMAYSFRRFFWANLIGYIPICWMYAFIGSRSMGQDGFMWAFGVNVFVAAILLGVNLLRPKERTVRTEN
ncbi:MAG: VTT domain-containing protein [Bacteroidota bacterium]